MSASIRPTASSESPVAATTFMPRRSSMQLGEPQPAQAVIVDQQDAQGFAHRATRSTGRGCVARSATGSRTQTRAPPPGTLSKAIRPPTACARSRMISSPKLARPAAARRFGALRLGRESATVVLRP